MHTAKDYILQYAWLIIELRTHTHASDFPVMCLVHSTDEGIEREREKRIDNTHTRKVNTTTRTDVIRKTYMTLFNFFSSSLYVCVRARVRSRRTTFQQNKRCYCCLFHRHQRSSTFRAQGIHTLFSIPSAFSPCLLLSFFCRC